MLRSSNKADASEIVAFLDELSEQPWLDARKKAWPNYIYHFNDIRNIASVLQQGVLCSRERCRTSGISFIDVADRLVVSESPWTHSYSRFYFRPHTPTQYLQEGIRPPSFRSNEAHCPVPVFLLFRSRELLIRSDIEFTDGNFGAAGHHGGSGRHGSAAFLRGMPWREIYHDEAFTPDQRSSVIYHRHAEVLCKDELDLTQLDQIVCRSAAERETLISLLGDSAEVWEPLVRLELPAERIFYRQWLHFEQVQLLGDTIQIRARAPQGIQFALHVKIWDEPGGRLIKDKAVTIPVFPPSFRIQIPEAIDSCFLTVEVEDGLAFQGRLSKRSLF